ncbi:MAG: mechanosensitive ion channel [Candidatus Wallbacteria bacterium]|nr:mechanosensitive ion channel [Candidatus Wallbacteria bacterium]
MIEKIFFRNQIWSWKFLGNSFSSYAIAVLTLLFAFSCMRFVKNFFLRRLKFLASAGKLRAESIIPKLVEKYLFPLLYYLAFYFAVNELDLSVAIKKLVDWFGLIFVIVQTTRFAICVTVYFLEEHWFKQEGSRISPTTSAGITGTVRLIFWILCSTIILDNLGFSLTTILAGMGIGGMAIALASQHILNDLFNYFVIFFDRPFEEGDFIMVGESQGTVREIGIKTTRLESVSGEQIVFSNSDLTGSRIRNYHKMVRRRVSFDLTVAHGIPTTKLKAIPEIVKRIISGTQSVDFDYCFFGEITENGLKFEAAYYLNARDFSAHAEARQKINLGITEEFEREKINLALPTRIIILDKSETA